MNFCKIFWPLVILPMLSQGQSAREMKFQELSVESTREFAQIGESSAGAGSVSISRKMNLFEMPEEYQCPLFSDSPYTDVLSAIDQMQNQLNTVFPGCEIKVNNDQLSEQAGNLRNKIFEAKQLQDRGQSYKLNLTINSVIQMTQQLQQSLALISQSQTKVCYRSNQQFRNVIFSINETFQSLAPIVLDFVKNNPALAQTMGPTIKILAGAQNISEGISMIEKIAKDSVMFDMTDATERVHTIKNVCQFMKLYRRVQYLRLSKLGNIQSVHSDFQKKINLMSQKLLLIKNQLGVRTQEAALSAGLLQVPAETDPALDLFEKLSKTINGYLLKTQKALADVDSAKEQYNLPLIPQCQIVLAAQKNTSLRQALIDVVSFSDVYGESTDIDLLNASLKSNERELTKNQDQKMCVQLGQDWLNMAQQILVEGRKLVLQYESKISEVNGEKFMSDQKRILQKEKQIENEKSNFESLKTLINVAAFESAELEKRFKDMHRYLFKGPDFNEVNPICNSKDENSNCFMSSLKAAYQWYRNDGPIYELLKNDEQFFEFEYNKVKTAVHNVIMFERKMTRSEFGGKTPLKQKDFDRYLTRAYELSHLNLKFLTKNSPDYVNMCRQSNMALNSYLKATEFLASSESLCNMIYPALDAEINISSALLGYCQPKSGRASKIQQQIIKLVGAGPAKNLPTDVYDNNFKYSMKSMVDKLIQKYDDLGCEQKSGLN